jgi:tRNA nucleotidyltransferase (CCA-adding enzyme)
MKITLTPSESRLFSLLLDTCQHFALTSTLRVAGGWVRDKLLGLASDDIDIALDTMMGREFAQHVQAYMAVQKLPLPSIGVIAANPEQSKHLETATMRLFDHWVDFVHLRAESYSSHSRIPTVVVGTPLQDALRRDFTINALFYNIQQAEVEDFTGKGISMFNLLTS